MTVRCQGGSVEGDSRFPATCHRPFGCDTLKLSGMIAEDAAEPGGRPPVHSPLSKESSMLRLQCQSSMAYFNVQCAQCLNFVRLQYLGFEQGVPTVTATCDTCRVTERLKLGNRWSGLPVDAAKVEAGLRRERDWVKRGGDRRRGVDRRRSA